MQAIPEKDRASHGLIKLESDLREARPVTNTTADSLVFTIDVNSVKSGSEKLYTKREVASLAVYGEVKIIASESVDPRCWLG